MTVALQIQFNSIQTLLNTSQRKNCNWAKFKIAVAVGEPIAADEPTKLAPFSMNEYRLIHIDF